MSHPSITIQILYRDLSPLPRVVSLRRAPCRHAGRRVVAHPGPYRGASCSVLWCILRRIAALLRCIVTQRSPHSATIQNFCIATSASLAMRARSLSHALHACQLCRSLYRGPAKPCRGRGLAVSWPLQLCPTSLCHDTIHCIVTQMGSSSSSWLLSSFFFFSLIFFFICSTRRPPKKCFFFSFSNRT